MESGILSTGETEGKLQYAAGIKSSRLKGFDQQMEWLTSKLVEHYYGHKYDEPTEIPTIPNLNAGSFAVHSVLALTNGEDALDPTKLPERGRRFIAIYRRFRDPLEDVWWKPPQGREQASAPRVGQQDNAIGILQTQPYMLLPWTDDESWHFTGGPHNYSGNCCSRPWSSLDYAPQGPAGCDWTSYSQVKAARRGTVVESSYALVKVDHQQEVWEEPWLTSYFHLRSRTVTEGNNVTTNTMLGYPSCQGGATSGVHLHFLSSTMASILRHTASPYLVGTSRRLHITMVRCQRTAKSSQPMQRNHQPT